MAIEPFYLFGPILGSLRQRISELGGPTPTRLVPRRTPAIDPLTCDFRFRKKFSSMNWRHSEQTWYRNLGQNLGLFARL